VRLRIVIVLAAGLAVAAVSAGCGSGATSSSRFGVVAAENVYGDIVGQIGGSHVEVTSLLTSPTADPHLFEPGTRNGLEVAQAKLVVQNGLGYDAFIDHLEQAAPSSSRHVLVVADVVGIHGRDANPHLWYDVPELPRIARAITAALVAADPKHAAAYRSGEARFIRSLAPLQHEVAAIRAHDAGSPVAYTEPVPGYLVQAAGLRNLSPESFARALEDGTEPSPQAVNAMTSLIARHEIRVLLYNSQTVSPLTSRIRSAAASAGIPVVPVTETLPPHMSFQRWQLAQARALERALALAG
jgi:zinc/manganese transport system substrate-binding protein